MTSDKMKFKPKSIKGDREGDDKRLKATIHNESVLVINIYVCNNRGCTGNRNLLVIGSFNTCLSSKTDQVDNKDVRELEYITKSYLV